jgi:hypothetical protein
MRAEDELLIRAAMLADERGIAAWRDLRQGFDVERVGLESYLLLPLLYRNLSVLSGQEQLLSKLKSVYRHTWAGNQLLLRALADLVDSLEAAGIPTLVLKGAALLLNYYGDLGTRPMSEFDVLVPATARDRAFEILEGLGWSGPGERVKHLILHYNHAIEFRGPDGRTVGNLHWRLMSCLRPQDDLEPSTDDFWAATDSTEIFGTRSRTPSPGDLLLQTCVDGWRDGHVRLLSAADALHILASSSERLDWDRLVGQASRRGAILPLRRTLEFLTELDAAVPARVMEELVRPRVTRRQAYPYGSLHRFMARNADQKLLGRAARLFDIYGLTSADWPVTSAIRELPTFLHEAWEARSREGGGFRRGRHHSQHCSRG